MFVITKTENGGYGRELNSYPIGVVEEVDDKCIAALDELVSSDLSGEYANIPSSCGYSPVWSQAWYNLFEMSTAPYLGGSLMALTSSSLAAKIDSSVFIYAYLYRFIHFAGQSYD